MRAALPGRRCQRHNVRASPRADDPRGGYATLTSARRLTSTRAQTVTESTSNTRASASEKLSRLIQWADANGVQGFGHEDSNACLFLGDRGERGVLAQRPLERGTIIVEVPLRLALADHPFDKDSNVLLQKDAPWSARLAAHLLRERAKGEDSAWAPYIAVLPEFVPTPIAWPWRAISAIKYEHAAMELHEAHWVIESALGRLTGDAIGVPRDTLNQEDEEAFRWACSVVHSRTFATAAKEGGVPVCIMVPIIDMFNHAGDEVRNLLRSRASACDNCCWEVVAPKRSNCGEWAMQVIATGDVQEGEELCFSYGERSNDDMFVYYGFVPLRNPRDEVVLFDCLEHAADWYVLDSGLPVALDRSDEAHFVGQLRDVVTDANEAMTARLREEGTDTSAKSGVSAPVLGNQDPRRLALRAGTYVTPELIATFEAISGGAPDAARAAVVRRAWELLKELGGALLWDLAALVAREADAADTGAGQRKYWEFLLAYYDEALYRFCKAHDLPFAHPNVRVLPRDPQVEDDADPDIDALVEQYLAAAESEAALRRRQRSANGGSEAPAAANGGAPRVADSPEVLAAAESDFGIGRIEDYEEYLLVALMVNKRMILWDALVEAEEAVTEGLQ